MIAVKAVDAKLKEVPEPTDPRAALEREGSDGAIQVRVPDINGKVLSNTDDALSRQGGVVSISGSWCKNCHDEAPFLASSPRSTAPGSRDRRAVVRRGTQKAKGYPRLRAFNKRYGIAYPVGAGGEQADLAGRSRRFIT